MLLCKREVEQAQAAAVARGAPPGVVVQLRCRAGGVRRGVQQAVALVESAGPSECRSTHANCVRQQQLA